MQTLFSLDLIEEVCCVAIVCYFALYGVYTKLEIIDREIKYAAGILHLPVSNRPGKRQHHVLHKAKPIASRSDQSMVAQCRLIVGEKKKKISKTNATVAELPAEIRSLLRVPWLWLKSLRDWLAFRRSVMLLDTGILLDLLRRGGEVGPSCTALCQSVRVNKRRNLRFTLDQLQGKTLNRMPANLDFC